MKRKFFLNGKEVEINLIRNKNGQVSFRHEGREFTYDLVNKLDNKLTLKSDNKSSQVVFSNGQYIVNGLDVIIEKPNLGRKKGGADEAGHMTSPMPGKILKVMVASGDEVKAGDSLIVMEAMKMEHTIKANCDGIVESVHYQVGQQVDGGVDLVDLKEASK
jgi:3-methylcrotonyl-CoA carboxylase alpha subunit